ncbi:MAG: aspartyl/glutamyl-tRNA(Asn/Gln) amidotransferase subunit B [Ectothiorhodospiraceae bacterium]|nr:MAG: aspartyl/glutamyl-tRNA(Asn/Gln) amidotransferase subunit B [Ectothiorhodospiraceae bacterium]
MWETVIGLEIHVQLSTESKLFSSASTDFGADQNTQASIIDLAMPGVLPVLNKNAVDMAVKFGLAVDAKIARKSIFARKNYFYPDLPKGYQISQYELPIVFDGKLDINVDGIKKSIGITRAHLEEDAGKSIHDLYEDESAIDLNRAGTPLIEIVSEPDLRSSREAVTYLKKIHSIVKCLGISDGNMQEGSFRCDANISLRKSGDEFGTRAEIKNINSFKFVESAINYEVIRQRDILESGESVIQETRLYDPKKDETRPMRSKEEANDYRYFPDPDLLPVEISQEKIDKIKLTLPELPDDKKDRYKNNYGLKEDDAEILSLNSNLSSFFDESIKGSDSNPQLVANFILSELVGLCNKHNIDISVATIKPSHISQLMNYITQGKISSKQAKDILNELWAGKFDIDEIIRSKNIEQVSDAGILMKEAQKILEKHPKEVQDYKNGKDKLMGFFVGQVMKEMKGKANPKVLNEILNKLLKE